MPAGRLSNERATTGKRSAFLLDVSAGRQGPVDTSETCAKRRRSTRWCVNPVGMDQDWAGSSAGSSSASEGSVWVFGVDTGPCIGKSQLLLSYGLGHTSGCELCVEAGRCRSDWHVLGRPGDAAEALVDVAWGWAEGHT